MSTAKCNSLFLFNVFKNLAIPRLYLIFVRLFKTVDIVYIENLPKTGFEPRTSGVGSNYLIASMYLLKISHPRPLFSLFSVSFESKNTILPTTWIKQKMSNPGHQDSNPWPPLTTRPGLPCCWDWKQLSNFCSEWILLAS